MRDLQLCRCGGTNWALAVVKIKTDVSWRTLDPLRVADTEDLQELRLASRRLKDYVQKEHMIQVSQELAVTGAIFGVYICTSEVEVLFNLVLYCPTGSRDFLREFILNIAIRNVLWGYKESQTIPGNDFPDDASTMTSKLPFYTAANERVAARGPMHLSVCYAIL